MIKSILLGLLFISLVACSRGPNDVVLSKDEMLITHVETYHPGASSKYNQQWIYYVTDYSDSGWKLYSNTKFELGDKIKIVKVESK